MKTTSGATAVQVVWSSRRGSRKIEHFGSAHDEAQLEALKAAAQQRIAAGQPELDLGLEPAGGGPLPITSSKMSHLVDSLGRAYRVLGFEDAAGGDEVFRHLVLARIIEPSSKLDSLRVLDEAGATPASYRTLKRRLPAYAEQEWRQRLSAACAAHARLGPASLVLYDVSTLYFETDQGDGFREPGFSKERRLEPQITIGLLTGQDGFPLMVSAFEGNRAETKTMLPVIEEFMAAHDLPDVTVVADAGMISETNQHAIEAAGLSFILGMKIPDIPYVVQEWRRQHPGEEVPDGHVFTQPWPAGPTSKRRDQQFAADLMRRGYSNVDRIDVTRPWRDGGRDAVGDYLLGPAADPVAVEFALEAKCYAPGHGVGVRETSRLISRLRHRQFGVLVTTSHLDSQAYKEIREDGHPVIVLAGRDITDILKKSGLDTITALRRYLHDNYPQR